MLRSAQPLEVVCWWDPAIDLERSNISAYAETRKMEHLVFRDGTKPTIFVLRPIPNRHAIKFLVDGTVDMQRLRSFQMSVLSVKNPRFEESTPLEWRPTSVAEVEGKVQPDIVQLVTDAELDLFDPVTIIDVGEVARSRAFLPRGTDAGFLVPRTSLDLLNRRTDLYAAMNRTSL